MQRKVISALESAFDRAAHDVFVASEVHEHCGDPEPSKIELSVYWMRGFIAGLTGDYRSLPLGIRFCSRIKEWSSKVSGRSHTQNASENR
ncbi:hypothetical protein [Pseudomonas syringae]|uniref:hypothetical protein n=1 Tax=Pseudomonas syringae TaxID=317 RepID=UPI0009ABDADE|nr:hypothetical protein [Pseudomonas syringae]